METQTHQDPPRAFSIMRIVFCSALQGLAWLPAQLGPMSHSVRKGVKTQERLSQPKGPQQGSGQRVRWYQGIDRRVRAASALHVTCPALVTAQA